MGVVGSSAVSFAEVITARLLSSATQDIRTHLTAVLDQSGNNILRARLSAL